MADTRPCVLVVDDDRSIRDMLTSIIEEEGYEVITASTGREALARVQEWKPHLVLLDLQMPGMLGQEVLAELRQAYITIPVVFMSAGLRVRVEAEAHGADGYLVKPFDLTDVLNVVERFCGPAGAG